MIDEEILSHLKDVEWKLSNAQSLHSRVLYNQIGALRAVVELHKPEQRCYDATCYCKDMCSKCKEDYPCSEIQVIEKALL